MFIKVFKNSKNAFTLLLLFGFFGITVIEALQCYDCYDCEDDEDLNELQICGEFPTTKAPGNGVNSENMTVVAGNNTLSPGNATTTSNSTKGPSFNEDDIEENSEDEDEESDDDEDDSERRLRPDRQMFSNTGDAVCYVVKLKVNDTTVTKRGCATFFHDDDTCESVSPGSDIQTCHLCEVDGCNKYAGDDDYWGALWNAGEKVNAQHWLILPLFILLTFLKY
uniref:Protein sleepless n=1 Tax=Bactrocera latifrons TaxID=174628 RepID=A0A0K8V226_BACLA